MARPTALLLCMLATSGCANASDPVPGAGLTIVPAGAPFRMVNEAALPAPVAVAAPATGNDAGAATAAGPVEVCSNVAGFTSIARPLLTTHCLRCHDGTKGRATQTYDLTTLPDLPNDAAQQLACDWSLTLARRRPAPAEPLQDVSLGEAAAFFAEVNPADPSTVHDFKFTTPAEYAAFRDGVMPWLSSE